MHGLPIWNWAALTVRAVAQRAGVNQRTVYRYFATERELRDAVLERFRSEAGVDLEGLQLEDLKDIAARVFEYVSSFPIESRTTTDPSVAAENERQRVPSWRREPSGSELGGARAEACGRNVRRPLEPRVV